MKPSFMVSHGGVYSNIKLRKIINGRNVTQIIELG
jgi:hypothetical protein